MDTFAPYDPTNKPDPLAQHRSPLKNSTLGVNPLTVPSHTEAPEFNPNIQRRTIRVTAEGSFANATRQPRDSSTSSAAQRRFKESYSLNNGRDANI